jgi:AMP deaminase
VTLKNLFDQLDMTAYDLSVDSLDVRANNTYHRFDRFNKKYSPLASQTLRTVFLKYDNFMRGRYLATITREVMDDLDANKYQLAEYRLSIYGRRAIEWDVLAAWVVDNDLFSKEVAWMIQIPRLYAIYRRAGLLANFEQMLDNIFRPLFQVTVDPASHPKLHLFLLSVVGFDSVDDESVREFPFSVEKNISPKDWTKPRDPCYARFSYYLYANLLVLNKLREERGLNSFSYRPHAGEAGDVEHLACTFLLARGINHGINLRRSPVLQYLYYLAQVGISVSPLSNNLLFLRLENNPFKTFFYRGLNVTLSTDDPLMIHVTKEPLVEEYSVAAQVWKLTNVDMVEIARNSVLQSGFSHQYKAHWIGNNYNLYSVRGNDIRSSNVPNIRMAFRLRNLEGEYSVLSRHGGEEIKIIDTVRI